jgi:hypothetical protein
MKKFTLLSILSILLSGVVYSQEIPNWNMETNSNWGGVNSAYVTKLEAHDQTQKLLTLWPVSGLKMLMIGNTTSSVGFATQKFAWTTRPDSFSFNAGYLPGNTSEMFGVVVTLSKWNGTSRDTVVSAFIHTSTPGQVMPWSAINISLTSLYKKPDMPDSGFITFINDVAVNGSGQLIATTNTVLVLDDIKFRYQAQSGKTFTNIENNDLTINQLFYSNGSLILQYSSKSDLVDAKLSVYNINGQMLYNSNSFSNLGNNNSTIDIPNLKTGVYILSLTTNKGIVTKKFIVQ